MNGKIYDIEYSYKKEEFNYNSIPIHIEYAILGNIVGGRKYDEGKCKTINIRKGFPECC